MIIITRGESQDRAVELIQTGVLRDVDLHQTLNNAKENLDEAKACLTEPCLINLAHSEGLTQENEKVITGLLKKGSNPDMRLPDLSKIIDHASDYSIYVITREKWRTNDEYCQKKSDRTGICNLSICKKRLSAREGSSFYCRTSELFYVVDILSTE